MKNKYSNNNINLRNLNITRKYMININRKMVHIELNLISNKDSYYKRGNISVSMLTETKNLCTSTKNHNNNYNNKHNHDKEKQVINRRLYMKIYMRNKRSMNLIKILKEAIKINSLKTHKINQKKGFIKNKHEIKTPKPIEKCRVSYFF